MLAGEYEIEARIIANGSKQGGGGRDFYFEV
jgi:hypothetical protein